MRPSTGERGETLHFSIPSINQSIRELRFHPFGFGDTVHNGSHDAKSYFHIWLHIVDALNHTTWFCSLVNPDYIDLKRYILYYPLRLGL